MSSTTKSCPNCGATIAAQAVMCPECKSSLIKVKKKGWFGRHPIITVIVVLVVIIAAVAAIASGSSSNSESAKADKQDASAANDVKQEEPPIVVDAKVFISEFDANKIAAQDKYKDKTVQTVGWISNISGGDFGGIYVVVDPEPANTAYGVEMPYFGTNIQCYPEKEDVATLASGQKVTVTGKVDDMSMMSVQFKNCKIAP